MAYPRALYNHENCLVLSVRGARPKLCGRMLIAYSYAISSTLHEEQEMDMKRHLFSIILAFAATVLLAHDASAASGGYGTDTVAPTIYSRNKLYYSEYPVPKNNLPHPSRITEVIYQWSYKSRPAGLQVWLCVGDTGVCENVTNYPSGRVDFSAHEFPLTMPIRIYARLNGSPYGSMYTLHGSVSEIIVCFDTL